jgi:hypothetical protein
MKMHFLLAATALAVPAPLFAQHQGHTMPAEPAPAPVDHSTMDHSQHQQAPSQPAPVDHSTMDHGQHQQAAQAPTVDHSSMDHSTMDQTTADHGSMNHGATTGALGAYPMAREASGTAWQPDTATHGGIHAMSGDWSFMLHGNLDLIHSLQGGPRGDDKTFAAGMVMGVARRPLGDGTLQFRAMVSPDPLMGKRGYPLLLASGETADGVEHLVDRQHPHDFFMELSASVSQQIAPKTSVFLYGGLPGEPAFGPPAFMHRQSISASPEAPITHHWLDSTHITFGVLTAGLVHDRFKVEVSRFNAREPDQHRWNIETGPLDSTAVRLSWNPTRTLALQGSWGRFKEPEQLEPGVDQKRWSASGTWTVPLSDDAWVSTTLAWGRKVVEGNSDDAFALESSLGWKRWTLFARAERTENRELVEDEHHEDVKPALMAEEEHSSTAYKVGKVSLGAMYELPVAKHLKLGLGALYAFNFVPDAIESVYGGDPEGAMGFLRIKID